MTRIGIAVILLATARAGAQQTQPVFEITGEIRDGSGRRVPVPVEISVIPCGLGIFDSGGRFRADCSKSSVHAGQPVVIIAEKDGWGPVAFTTAAPEGGALAMPIQMAPIPKTPVSVARPVSSRQTRPQVTGTFDVSNNGSETTLTVAVRNLTGKPVFLNDLVVRVDDVYEIRHAVQKLSPAEPAALSESDLPLLGKGSTSYKHIGLPLASPAETRPPLRFHLIDSSKAAERDHIYRARIEVTWNAEGDPTNAPASTEIPLLFLIEGRRFALDAKTTTQQETNAAVEWNRQELDRMELAKARRTPGVESLTARIKRFQPGEIQPNLTLGAAATANASSVQALLLAGADRGKPRDPKEHLIHDAAKAGNWELVSWLIDEGVSFGVSVIDFAAKADKADVVAQLISKGASPSLVLKAGAEGGHLDMVRLAFDKGAEPQRVDLCAAVVGRNLDVLKLFLSKGVQTSPETCRESYRSYDRATKSAMALAARTLQEDMLRALLETAGGPDQRKVLGALVADAIVDGLAVVAPPSVRLERMKPIIALLLRLGADVRDIGGELIASDAEVARMLVGAGADINFFGNNRALTTYNSSQRGIFTPKGESFFNTRSALLYAVAEGCDLKLVRTLRELGARTVPFRLLSYGKDPVGEALESYLIYHTPETFEPVECFLLAGADVPDDSAVDSTDLPVQLGFRQPWVIAVAGSGDARLMQLLLDNGANPNATGSGGLTPLLAVFEGKPSIEVLKLLLEKGGDPNKKDAAGRAPLVLALQRTVAVRIDMVRLLESYKANHDVTGFSYDDYSPLTKCAFFGDLPCVEFLLSKGEDPKKRDKGKRTPLAAAETPEIEKVLEEAIRRGKR
jgi:hypothetical protein